MPIEVLMYCTKGDKGLTRCFMTEQDRQNKKWTYQNRIVQSGMFTITTFGKIDGKIVAKFILKEIDEYESEFSDDNAMNRICIRNEDGDENDEKYFSLIASNEYEEESPYFLGDNLELLKNSCLKLDELKKYVGNGIKTFYAWHIDDLEIFDVPLELGDFVSTKRCNMKVDNLFCSLHDNLGKGYIILCDRKKDDCKMKITKAPRKCMWVVRIEK